jgi:adenylosuccinate synthase
MYDNLNGYVDVVVGGQAGSEGKGAVVAQLSRQNDYTGAVRCGGSNAGHTVYTRDNTEYIFQVLPVPGLIDSNISLYIGAESFFTIDEIKREIEILESVWGSKQKERIYMTQKRQ